MGQRTVLLALKMEAGITTGYVGHTRSKKGQEIDPPQKESTLPTFLS